MKKINVELAVGLFVILGILCLGYLSVKLGKMEVLGSRGYEVVGVFSNSGGVKSGSVVTHRGRAGRAREKRHARRLRGPHHDGGKRRRSGYRSIR